MFMYFKLSNLVIFFCVSIFFFGNDMQCWSMNENGDCAKITSLSIFKDISDSYFFQGVSYMFPVSDRLITL